MIVHTQLASFPRPGLGMRLIHSVQTVACVSASTEHVTISSFGTTSAIATNPPPSKVQRNMNMIMLGQQG